MALNIKFLLLAAFVFAALASTRVNAADTAATAAAPSGDDEYDSAEYSDEYYDDENSSNLPDGSADDPTYADDDESTETDDAADATEALSDNPTQAPVAKDEAVVGSGSTTCTPSPAESDDGDYSEEYDDSMVQPLLSTARYR